MSERKSIPEIAADVYGKRQEVERAIDEMRRADRNGNWSTYKIAADDAMGIARDGLVNAWNILERFHQLMREAEKKPCPECGTVHAPGENTLCAE